ncbi:MAG: hypothetical protein VW576_04765 [Opitutae bacterium]
MYSVMIIRFCPILFFLLLCACGGPDEGIYQGKIGDKKKVEVRINQDGEVVLAGYWQEAIKGIHEHGTYQGQDMDALVFEGPAHKKFKMRLLYQEDGNDLIIRAVQSRTFGPGARYLPTEEDSVFNPPPRLTRQGGD